MLGSVTIATSSYFFFVCCCLLKYFIYSTKHVYISSGKIQKKICIDGKTSGKLRSNRIGKRHIYVVFRILEKIQNLCLIFCQKKNSQGIYFCIYIAIHIEKDGVHYFILLQIPFQLKIKYCTL